MVEQLAPGVVAKGLLAQGKEIFERAQELRAFDEQGEGEPLAREMGKAIGVYDELATRFGSQSDPAVRELVAEALMGKAECFLTIKRYAERGGGFRRDGGALRQHGRAILARTVG